jgi:hypothetical protein
MVCNFSRFLFMDIKIIFTLQVWKGKQTVIYLSRARDTTLYTLPLTNRGNSKKDIVTVRKDLEISLFIAMGAIVHIAASFRYL